MRVVDERGRDEVGERATSVRRSRGARRRPAKEYTLGVTVAGCYSSRCLVHSPANLLPIPTVLPAAQSRQSRPSIRARPSIRSSAFIHGIPAQAYLDICTASQSLTTTPLRPYHPFLLLPPASNLASPNCSTCDPRVEVLSPRAPREGEGRAQFTAPPSAELPPTASRGSLNQIPCSGRAHSESETAHTHPEHLGTLSSQSLAPRRSREEKDHPRL